MLHQVLIISITYLKLVLMFRAIVHALWSSVILVGLVGTQFADNSPGLSTELELALQRQNLCTQLHFHCHDHHAQHGQAGLLLLGYLGHYPGIFQKLRENCT